MARKPKQTETPATKNKAIDLPTAKDLMKPIAQKEAEKAKEDARDILQLLLEDYGATVTAYGAARPAMAALRAAPGKSWPDVLVSDIALGDDEDGYALLREVRELETQRDTPLEARLPAIALSGYDRPEDRTRALLAGFQLHLAKPTEQGELVTAILSVLHAHPARRAPAHVSHAPESPHSAQESP